VCAVLVDTGPLIALLDRSDAHHEEVVRGRRNHRRSVGQCLAGPGGSHVYLLSFSCQTQSALWEIFETGAVRLLSLDETDIPSMKSLMEKYQDLPMDMADAALVRVAEREGIRRVLTLDRRDFSVYRLPRKGLFTLLP
jgi:predicted nucleic acid-binding protein